MKAFKYEHMVDHGNQHNSNFRPIKTAYYLHDTAENRQNFCNECGLQHKGFLNFGELSWVAPYKVTNIEIIGEVGDA